ncbi:MAG TPA: response regulator [Polyangiaceae bacterium]
MDRSPPPLLPGRVLVIDDDVDVGRALKRTLRGHDVVAVSSGREALDLLATGATFDVIFCDLMMPDLSGPDVYESLEKTRPDVCERMVFVSGGAFTPQTEAFVHTTTCALVAKPFDTKALRAIVAERVAAGPR